MPTPEPTPEPTIEPTPEPTPQLTAAPTIPPVSSLTSAESGLLERTAALDCEVFRVDGSTAEASVACDPGDEGPTGATLQAFPEADALKVAFDEALADITPAPEEREKACQGGKPGIRKWGFGTIACTSDEAMASIIWTDNRTDVLGRIEGSADDPRAVFKWWQDNARALGRSIETPPEKSPQPNPSDVPPLVRVPGAPRAISCDATSEPIADTYGRIWEVDRVEFVERGTFERVVIHLGRVGNRRNVRDTEVVVERMPVSRLRRAVPNAPRPTVGKTAIVVDLDGVRKAPDLRRYRPSSTNIIKELSIVPDGGSRTAVISTARGTCYQVRVPIFGPSATGKEKKAEVYIDLK